MATQADITQISEGIPVLGMALLCAIIAGKVAKNFKVPKVTAFIFIGIILGPSLLNLITHEIWQKFSFLNEVAFGLILFNIGGEFNKHLFKKLTAKQFLFSLFMLLLTFILVSGLFFIFTRIAGMDLQTGILTSLFLGVVAMESAPPTTLIVMKEYDAKGPLSQSVVIYLAIGTCLALIGSQVLTMTFQNLGLWTKLDSAPFYIDALKLVWNILGAVITGIILGFALSYWEQKEKKQSELLLVVAAAIMVGQTLSYYMNIDPLIISLSLGFAVVNTSSAGEEIHKNIKEMGLSIYALFFVMAGAHIDLKSQLSTLGVLGTGYIISRFIGIYMSGKIVGSALNFNEQVSKYKGLSVLSHAGTAVAIALSLSKLPDQSAKVIMNIITASIFIFEIAGPFLLKFSLSAVSEIDTSTTGASSTSRANITFGELINNFLTNLRLKKDYQNPKMKSISEIVRKDSVAIQKTAVLSEVSKFIKEHEQAIYPVIDHERVFEGIISLENLKNAVLDKETSKFMRAENVIGKIVYIEQDYSMEQTAEIFLNHNLQALPVVDSTTKKLLGILYHKDLVIKLKEQGRNVSKIKLNV